MLRIDGASHGIRSDRGSGRCDFRAATRSQFDGGTRLFTLPDETVVWPGHDYRGNTSSTIGEEKRKNPRFFGKTREAYIDLMGKLGLPFPEKVQQSLQVNQSGFETSDVAFPQVSDLAALDHLAVKVSRRDSRGCAPLILDVREPESQGELATARALGSSLDARDAAAEAGGVVEGDVVVSAAGRPQRERGGICAVLDFSWINWRAACWRGQRRGSRPTLRGHLRDCANRLDVRPA